MPTCMTNANLREADLTNVNLYSANLTDADLDFADLTDADFFTLLPLQALILPAPHGLTQGGLMVIITIRIKA